MGFFDEHTTHVRALPEATYCAICGIKLPPTTLPDAHRSPTVVYIDKDRDYATMNLRMAQDGYDTSDNEDPER